MYQLVIVEFCSSLLSLIVAMLWPGLTTMARAGLFVSMAYLRILMGVALPLCSWLHSSFNLKAELLNRFLVLLPVEDFFPVDISDCDFLPIFIGTGCISSLKSSCFSSSTSTSF